MLSDTIEDWCAYGLVETWAMIHADFVRMALERSIVYIISSSTHIALLGTLFFWSQFCRTALYSTVVWKNSFIHKCYCEGGAHPLSEIPLMFLPECVRHLECPAGELLDSQHGQGLRWKHLMSSLSPIVPQIAKRSLCGRLCEHAAQMTRRHLQWSYVWCAIAALTVVNPNSLLIKKKMWLIF